MNTAEMPLDELTHRIIGAAIEVHGIPGPGLLESVYQECLIVELRQRQLGVERERQVCLNYKDRQLDSQRRLDLPVEGRVLVEVKAKATPDLLTSCSRSHPVVSSIISLHAPDY